MGKRIIEGHPQICFNSPPSRRIQVTVGKSVCGVIAYYRPPLALCKNFKLDGKPDNSPLGNLVLSTYARIDIQRTFILNIFQYLPLSLPFISFSTVNSPCLFFLWGCSSEAARATGNSPLHRPSKRKRLLHLDPHPIGDFHFAIFGDSHVEPQGTGIDLFVCM